MDLLELVVELVFEAFIRYVCKLINLLFRGCVRLVKAPLRGFRKERCG